MTTFDQILILLGGAAMGAQASWLYWHAKFLAQRRRVDEFMRESKAADEEFKKSAHARLEQVEYEFALRYAELRRQFGRQERA